MKRLGASSEELSLKSGLQKSGLKNLLFLLLILAQPILSGNMVSVKLADNQPLKYDIKFEVVDRGKFSYGTINYKPPVFLNSSREIFCPNLGSQDSVKIKSPEKSSNLGKFDLDKIYFIERFEDCPYVPKHPDSSLEKKTEEQSENGIPSMFYIAVHSTENNIGHIANRLEKMYSSNSMFSKLNVGIILVDPTGFDYLNMLYLNRNDAFEVVLDFKTVFFS